MKNRAQNDQEDKIYGGVYLEKGYLGQGGNGKVLKVRSLKDDKEYALKVFRTRGKNKKEKEIRYARFINEITIVREIQDKRGIIPILDCHIPSDFSNKDDETWYVMPIAEQFDVCKEKTMTEKLREMRELAYTLSFIHEKGIAHRDIKCSNILYLNGKICLSDFGIFWNLHKDNKLTAVGRRVGPEYILPEELQYNPGYDFDFRTSDVYLFAKLLWMYLKASNRGFSGSYSRDNDCKFESSLYGFPSFEPIHNLMENGTRNNPLERIDIDECIRLIDEQIAICEGTITKTKLAKYKFQEDNREFIIDKSPEAYLYHDIGIILLRINNVMKTSYKAVIGRDEIHFGFVSLWKQGTSVLVFSHYQDGKIYKRIYANIVEMRINNDDTIRLKVEKYAEYPKEFVSYFDSAFLMNCVDVCLNDNCCIDIIPW